MDPGYLAAVKDLFECKPLEGFDVHSRKGWVCEVADGRDRCRQMGADYVRALLDNKSVLVVSPTHAEAGRITRVIPAQLRDVDKLGDEGRQFSRLVQVDASEPERGLATTHRPGDVIQFHHNAKGGYVKGQRVIVTDPKALPLDQAARYSPYRPEAIARAEGDVIRLRVPSLPGTASTSCATATLTPLLHSRRRATSASIMARCSARTPGTSATASLKPQWAPGAHRPARHPGHVFGLTAGDQPGADVRLYFPGARAAALDLVPPRPLLQLVLPDPLREYHEQRKEVHSFRVATGIGEKKALAYSPDGRFLAATGEDGTQIDIWNTQSSQRFARLSGHKGTVFSVAFNGDGRLLASASGDHAVRIWNLAAAQCVAVLTGHTDQVFSAVFHPDGKRLASARRDRAIWLWDLATGRDVARLEGHSNYVFSLALSPDGTSLALGSGDGSVRIWDTAPPARRDRARRESEALRPEAERLVAHLFAELHQPADVIARLRADQTLSDPMRNAAMHAVMSRAKAVIP